MNFIKKLLFKPKEEFDSNRMHLNELPDDILERIFMFLNGSDLVRNASLVCKNWLMIINTKAFWIEKSIFNNVYKRPLVSHLNENSLEVIRDFYFKNPFNRNLINNPCGDAGYTQWCYINSMDYLNGVTLKNLTQLTMRHKLNLWDYFKINVEKSATKCNNDYKNWKVETDHNGAEPFYLSENVVARNFATTFTMCSKFQMIDLFGEGLNRDILKTIKPTIHINDNYAARFDCGSEYHIYVFLLNDQFAQIGDLIEFHDEFQQWNDKTWHSWDHVIKEYDVDSLRYILLFHEGKDTQFWAGHYGIKITNTSVRLLYDN